jgi:DNA modification methylase
MGKEWDSFRQSLKPFTDTENKFDGYTNHIRYSKGLQAMINFQNWVTEWASECYRVLKPGGFLVAFGGCYDDKTEILTNNGWKYFKDVTKEDEVITLNPKTHFIEYQKPKEIVQYDNYKKLIHFKTNKIDLCVTQNHKMFVKNKNCWILKEADKTNNSEIMKKNGIWNGKEQEYFILPKTTQSNGHYINEIPEMKIPMDIWLKFFGLWIAEGSSFIVQNKKSKSYINQIAHFNNDNLQELKSEIDLYFKVIWYKKNGQFRINSKQLAEYLQQFGYCDTKFVPDYIKQLSSRQIKIFLEWYLKGNGEQKRMRCFTVSKRLRDDLQELALKIGISADYVIEKNKKSYLNGRLIETKKEGYTISFNTKQNEPQLCQKRNKKHNVKTIVDYNGIVYCVEVEKYHTLYVRRNGKTAWCGNTRTFHRLAVGIENAGFNCKDTLMLHGVINWTYGCLSEDSEILTTEGWKKYNEIQPTDLVFTFNMLKNNLEISKINELHIYDYNGEMINLKNDNTDQLLSPSHKVVMKQKNRTKIKGMVIKQRKYITEDNWNWKYAFEINKGEKFNLPLASIYEGNYSIGIEMANLIGWILSEGHFHKECSAISILQSSSNKEKVNLIRECLNNLKVNFSEYKRNRIWKDKEKKYTLHEFYIKSGEFAKKIRELIPNKKPTYKLLQLKYEERLSLIHTLLLGNGNRGKYFYQNDIKFLEWYQILCHITNIQCRLQIEKNGAYIHFNPTTEILSTKHLKKINYKGKIWSIATDNITYIARRNGKIFITGNTGFPKATDISKQLDKYKGISIEKSQDFALYLKSKRIESGLTLNEIDNYVCGGTTNYSWFEGGPKGQRLPNPEQWQKIKEILKLDNEWDEWIGHVERETVDIAKEWEGWKTCALKPSYEPILIFMKPTEQGLSTTQNVVKWGVGAINVDISRIELNGETPLTGKKHDTPSTGRFPANTLLIHHPLCEYKGTKKIKGNVQQPDKFPATKETKKDSIVNFGRGERIDRTDENGLEEIENWKCHPDCMINLLGKQSGETGAFAPVKKGQKGFGGVIYNKYKTTGDDGATFYNDKGTASRFFKQFAFEPSDFIPFYYTAKANKKERNIGLLDNNDLKNYHPTVKPVAIMKYLVNMFTKPGYVVMDPFMGSGTTAMACVELDRNFIGFEKNEEYKLITESRIEYSISQKESLKENKDIVVEQEQEIKPKPETETYIQEGLF